MPLYLKGSQRREALDHNILADYARVAGGSRKDRSRARARRRDLRDRLGDSRVARLNNTRFRVYQLDQFRLDNRQIRTQPTTSDCFDLSEQLVEHIPYRKDREFLDRLQSKRRKN